MRLIRLQAENIKGVEAVDVTFDGEPVHLIGGPNGAGKSSALDAILIAMRAAGAHPVEPIRRGRSHGGIKLDFGDLRVEKKLSRNKSPQLTVTNRAGVPQRSPQAMLDGLCGAITHDPLHYARLSKTAKGRREQVEILRGLMGLDWTDLETETEKVRGERYELNRDVDRLARELGQLPEHADAPGQPVDTAELVAEQHQARTHDRVGEELTAALAAAEDATGEQEGEIARIGAEIAQLQMALAEEDACLSRAQADEQAARLAAENHRPLDRTVATIETELANAGATNLAVEGRLAREAKADELCKARTAAATLTARLGAIERQKRDELEAADFPIDGLGFGDDGVLYNGFALQESSQTEQFRVSIAIGIRQNPELPMMCARDGSLLDSTSQKLLYDEAKAAGGQVLLEHALAPESECALVLREGKQIK